MPTSPPLRIAIFASGKGSNAQQLIAHFAQSEIAHVTLLVSNKPKSGIFDFGPIAGIPTLLLTGKDYADGAHLLHLMKTHHIDVIVLAGYLKLVPADMVAAYPRRIINIHPSLLPAYGGAGMYGANVHEAVLANQESHSGITIHYVDEVYDRGDIIFQAQLSVMPHWTAADLQAAIHKLEHQHFPPVIEKVCIELRSQQEER